MSTRKRHKMRELIEVTLECVSTGEITREFAARKLSKVGVPLSVIGRVLASSQPTEPQSVGNIRLLTVNPASLDPTRVLCTQSAPLFTQSSTAHRNGRALGG